MADLPEILYSEPPLSKLMYLWFEPRGLIQTSTQALADTLGVAKPSVIRTLNRLRELGLLIDEDKGSGSVPPRYYVRPGALAPAPSRQAVSLPKNLVNEVPSVKFLWLWLKDQRAPRFTIVALEERLGLSHRTVFEGLKRLEELGRLERNGQRLKVK